MSEPTDIVCFSCGNPVGDPPALNQYRNGEVCTACRDRALEAIAPALPSRAEVFDESLEEALEETAAPEGHGPISHGR